MKKAKILATVGPASNSPEKLAALLKAGTNGFRLNCSHASLEELARDVRQIRRAAEGLGLPAAVVLDLQGPRLRTGRLQDGQPVRLDPGRRVAISIFDQPGNAETICTNYRDLPRAVSRGGRILLDDGTIELRVLKTHRYEVDCEVVVGGLLKEHKGLNVPGATLGLPALTAKDRRDLEWGLELGVDYFALSFVREAADVLQARSRIAAKRSHAAVIAKIEREEAITNIESILAAADALMVARGDLAAELSAAQVPILQKQLVRRANALGKMVIVATQMLESMIKTQQPTRAEASDVANAVFDGADALMLSGETAVGLHPALAVRTMADIIRKAEASPYLSGVRPEIPEAAGDFAHALARAASAAATGSRAKAVVVFTLTGRSAKIMASYRPPVPIYALSPSQAVLDQLNLTHDVIPLHCPLAGHTDALLKTGEKTLLARTLLRRGDSVILMAGGTARHRAANMLKIHRLGELQR